MQTQKKLGRGRPRKPVKEPMKQITFSLPVRLINLIEQAHWDLQMSRKEVVATALDHFFRSKGIRPV